MQDPASRMDESPIRARAWKYSSSPEGSARTAWRCHVHRRMLLTLFMVLTISSVEDRQGDGNITTYAKQLMEESFSSRF